MKNCYKYFLFLGLFLISQISLAQLNFDFTEGKILIKGKVEDLQKKKPLHKCAIVLLTQKKGMVTDENGAFNMYVYPADTLKFSLVGYIPKVLLVGDIAEKDRYSIQIEMVQDFIIIKDVNIYPFKTKEEFARAFIEGADIPQNILISGINAPKYLHKEKTTFANPISAIYQKVKAKRRAANPDFKP